MKTIIMYDLSYVFILLDHVSIQITSIGPRDANSGLICLSLDTPHRYDNFLELGKTTRSNCLPSDDMTVRFSTLPPASPQGLLRVTHVDKQDDPAASPDRTIRAYHSHQMFNTGTGYFRMA